MGSGGRSAWWLSGGDLQCPFCLQRYVYEVEYRCVACDGGVCPLCVVRTRSSREVLCPACPAEQEAR